MQWHRLFSNLALLPGPEFCSTPFSMYWYVLLYFWVESEFIEFMFKDGGIVLKKKFEPVMKVSRLHLPDQKYSKTVML